MWDWTVGEISDQVRGYRERRRREHQAESVIALQAACLTAHALCGGKIPEVYEIFPFWEEEEVKEAKLAKYRRIMERYAARGGG